MMIFDGKTYALKEAEKLKVKVAELRQKGEIPKIASILIGENLESELYLSLKEKMAERLGVEFEIKRFPKEADFKIIIDFIKEKNLDQGFGGIMIQLPLPDSSSAKEKENLILATIDPIKDVDGLTPENLGLLMMGRPRFLPATARAIVEIIQKAKSKKLKAKSEVGEKWLRGEIVCLVGASEIVGKPLAMVLSELGATVTLCRSTTINLSDFTRKADILISAVGKPGLIKKGMVKEGAMVIDVGISKKGSQVFGDVDPEVARVAGFLTPVPGGVGPVTVISLFRNLIENHQGD